VVSVVGYRCRTATDGPGDGMFVVWLRAWAAVSGFSGRRRAPDLRCGEAGPRHATPGETCGARDGPNGRRAACGRIGTHLSQSRCRHVTFSSIASIASGREVGNPSGPEGQVPFGHVLHGHAVSHLDAAVPPTRTSGRDAR